MRCMKWFGLVSVMCVALCAWAVTETEIIEQSDLIFAEMSAECLSGEEHLIEDFNLRQAQSVPVLSPSLKPYYQTFEAGVMVFDPKGFSDGFINGLEGERADGIVVYPVTIYEDGKTYERIVVNASGKEIFRKEAPEGYDPLWYVKERMEENSNHEIHEEHERGAEGEIFDARRVVMEYQIIKIEALTEYSVAQAASQAASGGGRSMGEMSYGSNLLQFVDASWGDNGTSNEFTLAWELGTGTIQVIHCPNLLPHAFNWSTLFVTNLPGNTNELVFTHSPSGVLGAIHAFDVNVDTDGDGVANGEERYLDKTDENNQHDPCNMLGEITYETAHGGGGQTGLVYVVGVTSSNSWATNFTDTLSSFESTGTPYHLIKLASNTNGYFVKAYRDSDGNESVGTYEAQGIYSNGSVSVTGQVTGIDVVLTDPDTDEDQLGDFWEKAYWGDPIWQNGSGDPDQDKLMNLYEYYAGTDPTETGTEDDDDDGIKNDWETWHGLDKDDPTDADEDPDLDGFTNLEEYQNNGENFGTDPFDVLSHPTGAIYVSNTNGNDSTGNGSYTNMYKTIGYAKYSLQSGGRMIVMPGTYRGSWNDNVSIGNALVLGLHGAEETIIDLEQGDRAFYLSSTNTTVRGFSILNGYDDYGGAIRSEATLPIIESCIFSNNQATGVGGAINAWSIKIRDCEFVDNVSGSQGGGIYLFGTGSGSSMVERCSFTENIATNYGGAIHVYNFSGNKTLAMRNCLMTDNYAGQRGGGMYLAYGVNSIAVENCTVVDNEAGSNGGGIYNQWTGTVVRSSILWGNIPSQVEGDYNTNDVTYCAIEGWTSGGIGNISENPGFVDDEYRFDYDSPCRDAGYNADWMNDGTDFFGDERIKNGIVDMGLFEFNAHFVDVNSTNPVSPYEGWATAATNIQDAIGVATEEGVLILVTNGVYDTGSVVVGDGVPCRVAITNQVRVQSVNGSDETFIVGAGPMGANAVRCAYVASNAYLMGFTLTNGHTYISGDALDYNGGGVWCEDGGVIENCVIVSNSAGYGAGIYGGTIRSSLLFSNKAFQEGGGTRSSDVDSCTIIGNDGGGNGGGIAYGTAHNSIVYNNTPNNYYNSSISYSCTTPDPGGTGNITNAPLFEDADAGNYRLSEGSPCVNAGHALDWMANATDLDGNPRVGRKRVDMGAYETDILIQDLVLTLDVSGSMLQAGEMEETRRGSTFIGNNMGVHDMLGIVSFTNLANVDHELSVIGTETAKEAIGEIIYALTNDTSGGTTEVLAGLNKAEDELDDHSRGTDERAFVLYTDEEFNPASFLATTKSRIHTVVVRSDWHEDDLSWVAQRRRGYYLATPSAAGEMAVAGRNGFMADEGQIIPAVTNAHEALIDSSVDEVTFRVNWVYIESNKNVTIETPVGTMISPDDTTSMPDVVYHSYTGSVCYIVDEPTNGTWKIHVDGVVSGEVYRACAYGSSRIKAGFFAERLQYEYGEDMPITLRTSYATNVTVLVTNDWVNQGTNILLYDDGQHDDAEADDGLYGGVYTNTATANQSWRMLATVSGVTPDGDEFRRVTESSQYITGSRNQLSGTSTVTASDGTYSNKVALSWTSVSGASYYDVYRSYADTRENASLIDVTNGTSYDDTNVVSSSTYYYWIRGFNKGDFDSEFSDAETGYASP